MKSYKHKTMAVTCVSLMVCTMMLGGCASKKDVTFADLVQANRSSVLLNDHTSVAYECVLEDGSVQTTYVSKEVYTIDQEGLQIIYTPTAQAAFEEGEFVPILDLSEVATVERIQDYFMISNAVPETVTSCEKQGDALLIKTEVDSQQADQLIDSQFNDVQDNDKFVCEYLVDAKDYRLQKHVLYQQREGEEQKTLNSIDKVMFDVPEPAFVGEISKALEEMAQGAPDTTRTLSVTMDPDTDKEETISITVSKGVGVPFIMREGYSTLYLDRACTEVYEQGTSDENADLSVYCIPDKK